MPYESTTIRRSGAHSVFTLKWWWLLVGVLEPAQPSGLERVCEWIEVATHAGGSSDDGEEDREYRRPGIMGDVYGDDNVRVVLIM